MFIDSPMPVLPFATTHKIKQLGVALVQMKQTLNPRQYYRTLVNSMTMEQIKILVGASYLAGVDRMIYRIALTNQPYKDCDCLSGP